MPDLLIALKRLPYGRSVYSPGERFIASESDAKTLVAVGQAKRADDEVVIPPILAVRASVADDESKRKRGRPRKSGVYATRDMRADE